MDYFSGDVAQGLLDQAAPNWNYNHIPDQVLPALREAGVTEGQLETMLVENPRRYFGG